jgi:hypothetical protein
MRFYLVVLLFFVQFALIQDTAYLHLDVIPHGLFRVQVFYLVPKYDMEPRSCYLSFANYQYLSTIDFTWDLAALAYLSNWGVPV